MLDNVLAGPILRRTTPNRICVWLALGRKLDVSLEILDAQGNIVGASMPAELDESRFQLGAELFVYLLKAYSKDDTDGAKTQFSSGVEYQYRLQTIGPGGALTELDLKAAGLTYGGRKYPAFQVPGKLTSLLHGSCRKPHGIQRHPKPSIGNVVKLLLQSIGKRATTQDTETQENRTGIDSLSVGDTLLEKYYADGSGQRPDLLLLTGDQIYADDVDAALLSVLRKEAVNLTGTAEGLPLKEYADPEQSALSLEAVKLGDRMSVLKKTRSGFSSGEAYNHLMSFGEFAAMYIYIYGNAKGWKIPKQWEEIADQHVPLTELFTWKDRVEKVLGVKTTEKLTARKREAMQSRIDAVVLFGESLHKVRRLMANLPTYMIFDDHDVTDDWNITGHWYDQVRSSPIGRRIVSNALAAYWAFQGWGNDPDNFDREMVGTIVRQLNKTDPDPEGEERYDLLTWKHRGWGFSIPTSPPIIAMDSRTQRQPDNPFYPPRLLDRYALDWLRLEWGKLKTGHRVYFGGLESISEDVCPVMIAATPVFGFAPLEHIQRLAVWIASMLGGFLFGKISSRLARPFAAILPPILEDLTGLVDKVKNFGAVFIVNLIDAEAWTANLDGFTDFLDTVLHKMAIRKCVFLSGDVHYSFSAIGRYTSRSGYTGSAQTLRCYQLTSSALRNEPSDSQKQALIQLQKFEKGDSWWQRLKRRYRKLQSWWPWHAEHRLLVPQGGGDMVTGACNFGEVTFDEKGMPVKHILHQTDAVVEYVIGDPAS